MSIFNRNYQRGRTMQFLASITFPRFTNYLATETTFHETNKKWQDNCGIDIRHCTYSKVVHVNMTHWPRKPLRPISYCRYCLSAFDVRFHETNYPPGTANDLTLNSDIWYKPAVSRANLMNHTWIRANRIPTYLIAFWYNAFIIICIDVNVDYKSI